ncbi:MAG: hypothetical protein JNM17_13730 [Archangium sp.]|nr:hypothetical protein [Archangium sp.]
MDVLLLLAQVVLVVLLVVIPLFSGYDKWRSFSPQRKVVALALAVGIAVIVFGQYRRLVALNQGGIQDALGQGNVLHGPWYARRVAVSLWEWVLSVIAGTVLLTLGFDAFKKKQKWRAAGFVGLLLLMIVLGALVKLRGWN